MNGKTNRGRDRDQEEGLWASPEQPGRSRGGAIGGFGFGWAR